MKRTMKSMIEEDKENRRKVSELEEKWKKQSTELLEEKVDYKDVQEAFANIKIDYDHKMERQEGMLMQHIQDNQHQVEQQLLNIQKTLIHSIPKTPKEGALEEKLG